MFYIFNFNNLCIGHCDSLPDADDLKSRSEYSVETLHECGIGWVREGDSFSRPNPVLVEIDYTVKARLLRDTLRNSIDKFLLPASTISDTLVTEDQKNTLIQDSLSLAQWPAQEGWPYIILPELSDLCKSIMTLPEWSYPIQTAT